MEWNNVVAGCALMLVTTAGVAANADTAQSHQSIQAAVELFVTDQVHASHGALPKAKAGRLDSRLRLPACKESLETFFPAGARSLGNTTVGVRCPGIQPWTLYVPVKVSLYETTVVATRPLLRGRTLQAQDLQLAKRDLSGLHSGFFTEISQLVGKQTTRSVSLGMTVTAPMVKEPRQIKRGQRVSLVVAAGNLEVRVAGEALSDGVAGERIRVRNLSTKRVVEGVVLSSATIQVNM